jgi:hypothetical protein
MNNEGSLQIAVCKARMYGSMEGKSRKNYFRGLPTLLGRLRNSDISNKKDEAKTFFEGNSIYKYIQD